MRALRKAVAPEERERQGRIVADLVFGILDQEVPDGGVVLSYLAVPGELPTADINEVIARRWVLAVPRVGPEGLEAVAQVSRWSTGAYGISEPVDGRVIAAQDLAAIVVPGVAYTPGGLRLGQGGGYYDRLLTAIPSHTLTLGVCLTVQLVDGIPVETWDRPVQRVLVAP